MRLFALPDIQEYERTLSLLSSLQDSKKSQEIILNAIDTTSSIANCDGYFLFKVTPSKYINLEHLHIKSLKLEIKGISCDKIFSPIYIPDIKNKKFKNVIEICAQTKDIINTSNIYSTHGIDNSSLKKFDIANDYNCVSLLTVPLISYNGQLISILMFLNPKTSSGKITNFSGTMQKTVFSFCQLISVLLEREQQKENNRQFIEKFISVFSKIIYSKSPHEDFHNRKVPIIAQMLAISATTANEGPYKDFEMDDNDWNLLNISSLLHDCGKTVVPDCILNKSTKLETCVNRIHEIRNRFEILRRDAHIEYLQKRLNNVADKETLQADFIERVKKLHNDFEFIGKCNLPDYELTPDDLTKIDEISKQTYTRYFSRSVGLSRSELQKISIETADRPETENLIQERSEQTTAPFRSGEKYNLKTMKGALNDTEKSQIKEHASSSLDILSEIPFPSEYSDIIEILKIHKDIMNETNNNRQLDYSKTTTIGKIIAFSSVFEQLSSSQRPYEKTKKLSEILKIMQTQKNSGLIDADLYNIFIKNKT